MYSSICMGNMFCKCVLRDLKKRSDTRFAKSLCFEELSNIQLFLINRKIIPKQKAQNLGGPITNEEISFFLVFFARSISLKKNGALGHKHDMIYTYSAVWHYCNGQVRPFMLPINLSLFLTLLYREILRMSSSPNFMIHVKRNLSVQVFFPSIESFVWKELMYSSM